jgi:16S rRNA (guanine527-N7)-methyltransferase
MNDQLREAILYGARKLKMDVSSAQAEQLSALLDRVLRYNQRINVIARCSSNEAVQRHIIDSLALLRMADRAPHLDEWVDVGAGGGFPGLVWAIMRPERSFLLVESISKKAALIKRHVFELGLKNVQVAPLRFESLPKPLTPVGMVSRATFAPDRWLLVEVAAK